VLQLLNISKKFDGVHAVDDVSLMIHSSRITSLIGPNGAGKTTLFNIVTGFLAPDKGRLLFKGKVLCNIPPWQMARLGMARTFQSLRVFKKLTVLENVLLGIQGQAGEGLFNALFRFSGLSRQHRDSVKRAEELVDLIELSQHTQRLAETLSYGEQKLLSFACCLAADPDLLLLDEPVAGIQPEMIRKIDFLLRDLVEVKQKTVFLIEHDMDFVLQISDTVIVMDGGRIIAEGTPEVIRNNRHIVDAYLT
jgi:branched-chain amino acid transport system ATP-binding protein